MVGLIWFVQLVHYPLFERIDERSFPRYSHAHQRQTTWVVGPPMLAEVATALFFIAQPRLDLPTWMPWLGLGLLVFIWLMTAGFSVPAHGRLSEKKDAEVIRRLVWTNWPRTVAWTARGALACWMLVLVARSSAP